MSWLATHPSHQILGLAYHDAPVGLCYFDTDLRYLHINKWLAQLNGLPVEKHLGRTIHEVIPDVAAGVAAQLRHVVETRTPVLDGTVEAETPARSGVLRSFMHNYFPIVADDGRIVGVSCVVQDVSERRIAEIGLQASLRAEGTLERLLNFEHVVAEIAERLAATTPHDETESIDWVLQTLGRTLRTERSYLWRFSEDGESLRCSHLWTSDGIDGSSILSVDLGQSFPLVVQIIREGSVIRMNAGMKVVPAVSGLHEWVLSIGANSGLIVPITVEGNAIGMLGLDTTSQPRNYSDVVQERLEIVANMIGSTIERICVEGALHNSWRRLVSAQEAESSRIARELHDNTSQQLVSLSMDLAILRARPGLADDAVAEIDSLATRARRAASQVHGISRRLHSVVVEELGLRRALESEIDAFERQTDLQVDADVRFGAKGDLPLHVATNLFRIAQESLRNARKHARATAAFVSLVRRGKDVVLCIQDTGAGFLPEDDRNRTGVGLTSMEERARLLGGTIAIETVPGRGTTVTVRVPIAGGRP